MGPILTRGTIVVLSLAFVLFSAYPANCQVLYGTLVGDVTDQSGGVVPNANVAITSTATGLARETVTDQAGRFTFGNVLPGSYDLKISAPGFRTLTRQAIDVSVNNVSRADVKLEVGQITEQVSVLANAALLQTDKADTHAEITTKPISTLPLNVYRNYQALFNLVPGATPAAFQNSATDTPARALTTNVNGTPRNANITRVDGAINVNIWLPHHTMYVAPSETIETVNVATGSFDAEQGMAGGAAITVITKSGTNEFHGSGWEFHNNQHLRARNFFMPPGSDKPRDTLNMFGATLGGPIRKNRLFFFGGYEGTRQRTGGSGRFTVPTDDQRAGDFSSYVASGGLGVIYDPATGSPDGAGRQPFSGNRIPDSRISPIARTILGFVPGPNLAGTAGNYFAAATGIFDRDNYDVKINWNRNDKHTIWGKYSILDANVTGVGAFGQLIGPSVVNDPGTGHTFVQVPTIGHTYVFSPRLLLDQNFGFTRMAQNVLGIDFGKNWGTDVFHIPGTNGADPRQSGLPAFSFDTYSPYGLTQTWMPLFRFDQSYTHATNVTYTRGAHEWRFGFDLVRHHLNHWQPEIGNPRGAFSFGGAITALRGGAPPNQYNSFAGFLLGLPTSVNKSLQYMTMSGREWQFGWFARDRWQATRKLTLNLGLRYEYYPLMTRASSGIERLDLNTMLVYLGGRGKVPRDAGIGVSSKLFAPRVGVAYRATEHTVIRTGYGLTYDPLPISRPLRGWYPFTIAPTFVGADDYHPFQPLASGIPFFTGPDISTGVVPLPPDVEERAPGNFIHRGYIQSWNFTIERRLPGDLVANLGYVGTETTRQLAQLDVNAAAPGAGNNGRPYAAQFGRKIQLRYWDGYLSSNYHALQASVNRQFSKGLYLKGAYTFSKALNMTDDDGTDLPSWNWLPMFRRNYAPAGYDRTHILQMAWTYDLPIGKGKAFVNSGPAAWVLGNWSVNGVFYHFTGTPLTVTASGASLNAPGNLQTADQMKADVLQIGGIGPGAKYYDPAAFAPVRDIRFGTSGRNVLRGPGVTGADASLFRIFPIGERTRLEFRAEAFNVTNTPRFGDPATSVTGSNFMEIRGTRFDSDRQFRFGLKATF